MSMNGSESGNTKSRFAFEKDHSHSGWGKAGWVGQISNGNNGNEMESLMIEKAVLF